MPNTKTKKSRQTKKSHPWRLCPGGEHWVRTHPRRVAVSKKNPTGITEVEGHCRRNRSRKDQFHIDEIGKIAQTIFRNLKGAPKADTLKFKDGNKYDNLIRGWTKYWNAVFKPKDPLDPNLVKALIASESSFILKPPLQPAGRAGKARGLMQLTDQAIKVLGDEKGELKDHLIDITQKDIADPNISICAGIRWLFHKKKLASVRLKREASWEEAVAEYKSYLAGMISGKNPNPENFQRFKEYYERLKKK